MKMNWRKMSRTAVLTATAALVASLGVAATEQSASASDTDGYLWVYKDVNFGGPKNYFYNEFSDLSLIDYTYGGSPMNDSITSIDNRTDHSWCFYREANYVGYLFTATSHTSISYLSNYAGDYNDMVSSFKPC
jgi:hypothetical protein